MAELVIALLSPVATQIGKWIIKKIKKHSDQKQIKIDVKSPDYNGTANHWVDYLFENNEKTNQQNEETRRLNYAYLGDIISSSIEKDKDVTTIKFNISSVDKDAMKEFLLKQQWQNQNDPMHGNAVFSFALPQIAYANLQDEINQFRYKELNSVPLNGKYLFDARLKPTNFSSYDPDDFYRSGGAFEIPIYLDNPQSNYNVYPVTPPAPNVPDFATQTKIQKIEPTSTKPLIEIFVYCPFCGMKIAKKKCISYCPACGKSIQKHLNF